MVVIGLLLVVLAAVFAVGLMFTSGGQTDIQFFGLELTNLSARTLVLMGLAAGVAFMLGLRLTGWGLGSAARRRRERKDAAAALVAAERDAEQARIEQARIEQAQVEHARAEQAQTGPAQTPGTEPAPAPPVGTQGVGLLTPTSEERPAR